MKKYNGRFIITTVLIVSLLTGCGKTIDIPVLLEPVEMKYEGRKVTQKDIYDIEVYQGVVTPGMESIYFEEESVLKQVYSSIGKEVKRGEAIAVRDDRELYAQYEDLNAEIQYLEQLYSLQNRLAEIENELAMVDAKDLQNSVVAMQGDMKNNSPETYEEKQLLEEAFKELKEASIDANTVIQYSDKENYYKQEVQLIELNEKKERLEKLSKQVNNKTAVAPMDGKMIYISQINQENIEERFPQKETIGIIANQQEHYLSTDISGIKLRAANEIYTIVNGKKVELEQLTYSNKEKNIANKNGLSLEARFIIPDYEMKIGETYPIFIISNRKENVLAVSVDSLYQENSEYFVYRLEAGEKVKCPVTIGKRTSLEVEIMDGIKKDDLIYYPVENTIATNTPSIRVEEDDYVFTKKLDQTRVTTMYKTPIYCEVENAVIKELLVSTGDVIKKGDTLAYLFVEKGESNILDLYYQQEYLSEVSEFELAQLKEKKEKYNKKHNIYVERKKKNLEIYGIQEQLLTLKYKYQYEAINRLLSRTQEVVGSVEIKSTVDGKIENVTANKKGTSIKYGDLLCQVVQEESLSVLAVDEGLDALLYQPVTIDVYGKTDVEVKGKVVYANATFQRQLISKQFVFNPPKDISNIAYVELENKRDFDKIGSQFGVELQLHKVTKGIMIKKDDIYKDYAPIKINEATGSKESDGRAYVWVREENGYKKQYIKVGYSDSKYAWIIYGLEVGQEIATNVKG